MRLPSESAIVILTGAGISAESGVRTFRDADGLWEHHRIEEVASPEGFAEDPATVHRFYDQRRAQLFEVEPNEAHRALARLQAAWRGPLLLVTQNVDDLHERAGSAAVLHMHGELRKARCTRCGAVAAWEGPLAGGGACPSCRRAGSLRPHIVWFGEVPFELERIYPALARCALFVAIGTSGVVHPAASFVRAVPGDAHRIELNREETEVSGQFDERRVGAASVLVPALVDELLAQA